MRYYWSFGLFPTSEIKFFLFLLIYGMSGSENTSWINTSRCDSSWLHYEIVYFSCINQFIMIYICSHLYQQIFFVELISIKKQIIQNLCIWIEIGVGLRKKKKRKCLCNIKIHFRDELLHTMSVTAFTVDVI